MTVSFLQMVLDHAHVGMMTAAGLSDGQLLHISKSDRMGTGQQELGVAHP